MITSTQPDYNRFHSILLVKGLAMVFYGNERASLGHQPHTQSLFRKVTPGAVALIATGIRHCLVEYQHGIKRQTIKFEGPTVESETPLNHHTSKYRPLTIIIQ